MSVKDLQPVKAPLPIKVTPFGMVILFNDVQSEKAWRLICVMPFDRITVFKLLFF